MRSAFLLGKRRACDQTPPAINYNQAQSIRATTSPAYMMAPPKRRAKRRTLLLEFLAGAAVLCLYLLSRHYHIAVSVTPVDSVGEPCQFTKWVNPAVEPPEEELGNGWACPSERFCQVALRDSCLQRRPPSGPESRAYQHDFQLLVVSVAQPEQCGATAEKFSDHYKGCRRFGLNANLKFEEGGVDAGGHLESKPTILINCMDMMCDNWFHAIVYVAYSTAALMEQLGVRDLRGFALRILSNKRQGRELLVGLMENFKPDEIIYSQFEMQESQDLGCYSRLFFMGYDSHPFHCDLNRKVSINPTLVRMSRLIMSNMGFPNPPALPRDVSVLHAKRTGTRRILNPAEVEAEFRRPIRFVEVKEGAGWKEGFRRAIQTHREASVLFGIHGAGLTNLLFLPPGAVVIEVGNDGWVFNAFRNMAVQSGHYYMLIEVSKATNDSAVVLPAGLSPQSASVWLQPSEVRWAMDTAEQLLQLPRDVAR